MSEPADPLKAGSLKRSGTVLRSVHAAALDAGLSGLQWRALVVVIDHTLSYSKTADRTFLGILAAEIFRVERSTPEQRVRARRVLRDLVAKNLLEYVPPRAGNPNDEAGPQYLIRVPNRFVPNPVEIQPVEIQPGSKARSNRVENDPPTLKKSTSKKAGRAREGPNPAAVAARLEQERRRREGTACKLCNDYFVVEADDGSGMVDCECKDQVA